MPQCLNEPDLSKVVVVVELGDTQPRHTPLAELKEKWQKEKHQKYTLHLFPFFICLHFSGGGRMFGLAATWPYDLIPGCYCSIFEKIMKTKCGMGPGIEFQACALTMLYFQLSRPNNSLMFPL